MPSAFTVSHASTVSHAVAVAKIVIATVAVETVVVVEPIVSAGMAKASVVKKTLGCRGALVEEAGRAPGCRLVQKQRSAR
jgi:hypothetical protein